MYWCIAGGQRADRKETARSEGGRRGRERERERTQTKKPEREGRNGYGCLAIGFTTRARVFRRRRSWAVKEEGSSRDREKNR